MSREKGSIIILNGVSSSGKTTIAKALQKEFEEHYFWIANDTFCDMCSSKHWDQDWISAINLALRAMNHTIQNLSNEGFNVIVDQVFLNDETQGFLLEECIKILHNYPVLFVRVDCSLEELERREKERGDRDLGQAKEQLPYVHNHQIYDCEVDTSADDIEGIVLKILKKLEKKELNTSFELLYKKLQNEGTIYPSYKRKH